MLAILDYEAGNQTSVKRALEHLNIPCTITANPELAAKADGLIFPGVGAANQAMPKLKAFGLDVILKNAIEKNTPVLGICLGCQIFLEHSEEGNTKTLGLVAGKCQHFDPALKENNETIRIPHIGWNTLKKQKESSILANIPIDAQFYFVHSYFVAPEPNMVITTTTYGLEFCSIYGRDGLWGVQFHPEKSGAPGLTLLKNFYNFCRGQNA